MLSLDSDCAEASTCAEAEPVSPAPRLTSVMLVATFLFQPIRNWIQERLDRYFYRDRYDYRRTLIEFARASVEQLTVLVFTRTTDPITGARRTAWIRELYPDVTVAEVASQLGIGDPDFATKFARLRIPSRR